MAPLPKDAPHHGDVARQSFIPIGPNGTPFMPIFRFEKLHLVDHPKKTRLGTLGFNRAEERESPFFHFPLVLPNDLTITHFPFLRPVI